MLNTVPRSRRSLTLGTYLFRQSSQHNSTILRKVCSSSLHRLDFLTLLAGPEQRRRLSPLLGTGVFAADGTLSHSDSSFCDQLTQAMFSGELWK
jgi:hypothetical protein